MREKTSIPVKDGAEAFVSFFIQYCLQRFFKSKRAMAKELGLGYRSILLVTNSPERYKGATLVFQELVIYCIKQDISIDEIIQAFHHKAAGNLTCSKRLEQVSGLNTDCPFLSQHEDILARKDEKPLLAKAYLFMTRIRMICCNGCMHFWNDSNFMECLIQETMLCLIKRLCK